MPGWGDLFTEEEEKDCGEIVENQMVNDASSAMLVVFLMFVFPSTLSFWPFSTLKVYLKLICSELVRWYPSTLKSVIYKHSLQSQELYEFETNFNNFFQLKLMLFVRRLMGLSAKLRNFFLIFKTPELGSGAFCLKLTHRAGSHQTMLSHQLTWIDIINDLLLD